MTTVKKTRNKETSKAAAKKATLAKVEKNTKPAKKKEEVKTSSGKSVLKKEAVRESAAKKVVAKKAAPKKEATPKTAPKKEVVKKVEVKQPKSPESTLGRIKIKPTSVGNQTSAPVSITTERPKNVGVDSTGKRRLVVSYSNMKEDVLAAFKEKYPRGYSDYMGDLFKVDKPDGTSFYATTLETDDAIYLIKMVVTIDRVEDAQKTLFPDSDGSDDMPTEGETFPDDNTENMSDSDDDIE